MTTSKPKRLFSSSKSSTSSTSTSTPPPPNNNKTTTKTNSTNSNLKTFGILGLGLYLGLCIFKDGKRTEKKQKIDIKLF